MLVFFVVCSSFFVSGERGGWGGEGGGGGGAREEARCFYCGQFRINDRLRRHGMVSSFQFQPIKVAFSRSEEVLRQVIPSFP